MLTRRTFIALPMIVAACKPGTSVLEFSGNTMGTTYTVVVVDREGGLSRGDIAQAIETTLADVNAEMSNWDPASEVSRFNASRSTDPIRVSPALAEVVAAANDVRDASAGRFDISSGPLIELWGFGAQTTPGQAPSDAAIVAALDAVAHPHVTGSGALQKTAPEAEIFLSAIGKGHGVDRVADTLTGLGARDFMVEIGGDIFTSGQNADRRSWQIGIETPDVLDQALQQVVGLSDGGMATSGDYRNYFEVDGVRYSHILDARTGRPVTHKTASATVLTENAMLADAWATAMLVLGRDAGLRLADERNLAVLFVDREASGFVATPSARFAELQA